MGSSYEELQQQIAERKKQLAQLCEELFSAKEKITLEIGCGHGHFLASYAARFPEKVCVGIDIIFHRIERGKLKQERAELNNLHFIKAEAMEFLGVLPKGVQIQEVFLLFPDPWPKRRHHKNRLLQDEFLTQLASKCVSRAPFYFRTDFDGYFQSGKKCIFEHSDWELDGGAIWPHEQESIFQKINPEFQSLIARKLD